MEPSIVSSIATLSKRSSYLVLFALHAARLCVGYAEVLNGKHVSILQGISSLLILPLGSSIAAAVIYSIPMPILSSPDILLTYLIVYLLSRRFSGLFLHIFSSHPANILLFSIDAYLRTNTIITLGVQNAYKVSSLANPLSAIVSAGLVGSTSAFLASSSNLLSEEWQLSSRAHETFPLDIWAPFAIASIYVWLQSVDLFSLQPETVKILLAAIYSAALNARRYGIWSGELTPFSKATPVVPTNRRSRSRRRSAASKVD